MFSKGNLNSNQIEFVLAQPLYLNKQISGFIKAPKELEAKKIIESKKTSHENNEIQTACNDYYSGGSYYGNNNSCKRATTFDTGQ